MGSYYRLYTEVKIGDEWICINHMYPDIEKDNKEYLSVTYYSGSRSFFHETAEKLEELGHRTARSDLSRTLQERFSEFRDQENFFWCTVTDFEEMKGVIPKGYNRKENHAFVHKDTVFAYESGELDDIYDYLNAEEYILVISENHFNVFRSHYSAEYSYSTFASVDNVAKNI